MISTSPSNHRLAGFLVGLALTSVLSFVLPASAAAQNALTLSVTPTLFEMSANPGQVWRSAVKVVNSNPYDLTVYAEVVNFMPQGEGGTGKFVPVFEAVTEGKTLAEWVDITREPITIPRETSQQVPFTVRVPEDASPGGHFAAIMVGTRPPAATEEIKVRTAQAVTSLFFVRIAGDVVERGSIREFRTVDRFVPRPEVDFELRFENDGNVHLQPQGDITIYNMWGEERGVIPINHQTNFGNVLPESIRKFHFSWRGEWAPTEIGRYTAVATLAYGADERHFVTREIDFWVVPLREVAITLGFLALIIFVLTRMVKAYVRRMLLLSGIDPDAAPRRGRGPIPVDPNAVRVGAYRAVSAPVRSGVTDLRARLGAVSATSAREHAHALWGFVVSYRRFFLSVAFLGLVVSALVWYLADATTDQRAYEVTIENEDASVTLTSEDVIYDRLYDAPPVATERTDVSTTTPPTLELVNVSGVPGAVANVKRSLEGAGYLVARTSVDLERTAERSVIVFSLDRQDDAVALSQLLGGALLSADASSTTTGKLTVFVGADATGEPGVY